MTKTIASKKDKTDIGIRHFEPDDYGVVEYKHIKTETRGRKQIYNEPLNEFIGFLVTKTQRKKLEKDALNANLDLSEYLRRLVVEWVSVMNFGKE